MLNVDQVFVKGYTCVILMTREVILNITSLSGRDANRLRDCGNPAKILVRTQKFHFPLSEMPHI